MKISQRTGEVLIISAIVILWILFYTSGQPGGRGVDYQEQQIDYSDR